LLAYAISWIRRVQIFYVVPSRHQPPVKSQRGSSGFLLPAGAKRIKRMRSTSADE